MTAADSSPVEQTTKVGTEWDEGMMIAADSSPIEQTTSSPACYEW